MNTNPSTFMLIVSAAFILIFSAGQQSGSPQPPRTAVLTYAAAHARITGLDDTDLTHAAQCFSPGSPSPTADDGSSFWTTSMIWMI